MRMKKFTFMLIAALMAVITYSQAATPVKRVPVGLLPKSLVEAPVAMKAGQMNKQPQVKARAQKRAVAVADLPGSYLWEYELSSETAIDPTTLETTAGSAFVTIAAATDNTVTVSGMFTNPLTATVDAEEGTITIAGGQKAGTSSYGDYVLYGMFYYEGDDENKAGWYYSDIEGTIDDEGKITFNTWITRVLSGGDYDGYALTPYWVEGSTLTPSEGPQLVVLPEGVEAADYVMSYKDSDGASATTPVKVAVDGNDVYVQGISNYIPEAWVKGTKDGNQVTFAANQYVGEYGTYGSSYAFYNGDAVFTYDAETESYSATGKIFGVLADKYYDGNYTDPVMEKVVEKAATPADPSITALKNGNYGYYITFNIPLVDTDGNNLLASKLSYEIFTDVEKEVSPLTFTPATHSRLTENMTVIPYGFTENYDFYDNQIYLNDLYSADWNKIGIKSIYTGGDETHETEIQWYTIKAYAGEEDPQEEDVLVTLPEGVEAQEYTLTASGAAYANSGWQALNVERTALVAFNGDDVYVSGLAYFFKDAYVKGKLADGKVTFKSGQFVGEDEYGKEYLVGVAEDEDENTVVTDFVFTYDAEAKSLTLTEDAFVGESESKTEASLYTYLTAATYTVGGVVLPDVVTLPEGVEVKTWYLSGKNGDGNIYGDEVGVAFDGNDIYLQGLCTYLPEAWVKGTLNGTAATFASGQFYGQYAGEYNLFFVGTDAATGQTNTDVVFEYDAEAGSLTCDENTTILLGSSATATISGSYDYILNAVITVEQPEKPEGIVAPEDLVAEPYMLTAYDTYYNENVTPREVKVGFYGENEVYIQGLSEFVEDAWVKGTNDNGVVTIPETYMGVFESFFGNSEVTFSGAEFIYNATEQTFTSEAGYTTTDGQYSLDEVEQVVLTKIIEKAATPADPSVTQFNLITETGEFTKYPSIKLNIPAFDTEGNPMVSDKLSYIIYIVNAEGVEAPLTLTTELYSKLTEDMTEIPYNFGDSYDIYAGGTRIYLNQDPTLISSWKKIGVKSIYRGLGEEHSSNIGWYDIENLVNGISSVTATEGEARYFDLQGRAINGSAKGLLIKQVRDAQGNVKTVKVVRK